MVQKLLLHTSPFALGILLSYFFWESNMLLLVLYLVITGVVIMTGEEEKIELLIVLYGIMAAFVVEVLGTQVSGYQTFNNPDFLGIPAWLLVAWGFGFLLMKRVSLIIAHGTPWTK